MTVGVFDGVHLAHQRLIRTAIQLARRLHGTSVVVTFDPDPHRVLQPHDAAPALMSLEARLAHLRALGADWVWVIPFTRRFAQMTALQFAHRILLQRLHAAALVVGETFVFGRNRQGDTHLLRTFGAAHGLRIVEVVPIRRGGAVVSSSRIRRLIADGQLAEARRLLGRPPTLHGVVVRGVGRGRRLGVPTANLRLAPQVLPPRGVYAVAVRHAGRDASWQGVMNLGVRPTFGPGPLVCEVHLLEFSGALLGRPVEVSLIARLRSEQRFHTPEALRHQIRRDLLRARRLLSRPF